MSYQSSHRLSPHTIRHNIAVTFPGLLAVIVASMLSLLLPSCHEIEEYDNDPKGNFEALWDIIDRHYCFLDEKGIDWQEIHDRYAPQVYDGMTRQQLFRVCSSMLDELRDGHTNLSTPFATSYYRKWWSDYPQNYNERLIQEHYFNFNYTSIGAIDYGLLTQGVAYMRYSTFASGIGDGNLNYILMLMQSAVGLIIDVRDNGGGDITNVETLVRRFISEKTLAGYISHKTGPGHNDFSEPYPYYFDPAPTGCLVWTKPVIVLTNRGTFSAANNFVSIMKLLPNVRIVGATTGGGSGMPFSSELPNGWGVRFSACPVTDALGQSTEFGVEPTEGCAVDMDPADILSGHDTILDFAIALLQSSPD